MKKINNNFEKHRQIAMLFTEYAAAFSAITIDNSKVATYITKVNEMNDLLLEVVVPLNIIIKQRSVLNAQLREELYPVLGRVINMTKALNDVTMKNTFLYFSKELQQKPNHQKLNNIAVGILDYLIQHEAEALAAGFTVERIEKLQQLSVEAQGSRQGANVSSSLRRVARNRIRLNTSHLNKMLRDEIDWMMADYKDSEPVLHERYRMLRQRRKGSKSNTIMQTDLSGTVTNQLTGEVVKNASVRLVNANGFESITDTDGYYLIDAIKPGAHVASCFAPGFAAPADISFSIGENESLEVNFSLLPLQAAS